MNPKSYVSTRAKARHRYSGAFLFIRNPCCLLTPVFLVLVLAPFFATVLRHHSSPPFFTAVLHHCPPSPPPFTTALHPRSSRAEHTSTANTPTTATPVVEQPPSTEGPTDSSASDVAPPTGPWVGTEITVIIEGNWKSHSSYIKRYFSALAVITPYAELSLTYLDSRTDALTRESGTKNNKPLSMVFTRRSDRIPPIPEEVKHHPKSVNNLIVRQLLDHVKHNTKLTTFFKTQFQCISGPMSKKLVEQLELDPKTATCRSLSDAEVYAITQVLQNERFPDPSGKCLSPAGKAITWPPPP